MIEIFSAGIWRIPHLASYFDSGVCRSTSVLSAPGKITAIAGWGQRPTTKRARAYAARHELPFVALEDGFLRSCGLGVHGHHPLSIVIDDQGIYYDASQPSRLESLIASLDLTDELCAQAVSAMDLIRRHRLSKYNHAPDLALPPLAEGYASRILVIDQTFGDVSVRLGGADTSTFKQMLDAALSENPHSEVLVKTHPDVLSGKKRGYLGTLQISAEDQARVRLFVDDISPLCLLEQIDKAYVVTSQMGFEALLLGKPVVCFGQPWYAAWGLTDDRHPDISALQSRRNVARSLAQLFAAAYLQYARYIDPATGARGTIFDVIDSLARNKAVNNSTRGALYCIGMSYWKRAIVRPFLTSVSSRVIFVDTLKALENKALPADARIVIWGIKNLAQAQALAKTKNVPLWRMEDGFLRSVGLGSDLFRPVSLVLDKGGMYYDPASGSSLEHILATQNLDEADLVRANRFKQTFVARGMSKYNLGRAPLHLDAQGRRVLLVPGQVEDDASIMLGSPVVRTNQALLEAVRKANPDAYIMYKPHPDVVAGNRQGAVDAAALAELADQCVADANIIDCILAADEVHTMTSLSGFEALLHGKIVHCYGGPFYAGWGLTVDHFPLPHRQRRVSVDELVYGVMLDYPRYVLPGGNGVAGFVSAETVMAWLAGQAAKAAQSVAPTNGWRGWWYRKQRKSEALLQLVRDEIRAKR